MGSRTGLGWGSDVVEHTHGSSDIAERGVFPFPPPPE